MATPLIGALVEASRVAAESADPVPAEPAPAEPDFSSVEASDGDGSAPLGASDARSGSPGSVAAVDPDASGTDASSSPGRGASVSPDAEAADVEPAAGGGGEAGVRAGIAETAPAATGPGRPRPPDVDPLDPAGVPPVGWPGRGRAVVRMSDPAAEGRGPGAADDGPSAPACVEPGSFIAIVGPLVLDGAGPVCGQAASDATTVGDSPAALDGAAFDGAGDAGAGDGGGPPGP